MKKYLKNASQSFQKYNKYIFTKILFKNITNFQNLNIKIEDTSLRSVKENSRIEFLSSLDIFQFNSRFFNANNDNYLSHMFLSFHLSNLQIQNRIEKILNLHLLKLDSKVSYLLCLHEPNSSPSFFLV